MKASEVDDIRIDEDGSTYRQSFVDKLVEAAAGNWETVDANDYIKKLNESISSGGDIAW